MFNNAAHLFTMFTLLCVVVFAIARSTLAASPCRTPGGQNGDCKLINDCPSLFSIINQQPISRKNADVLRSHNCGFQGSTPKVCCPLASAVAGSGNLLPDSSSCGYFTEPKIVGGEKTTIDEFPWMALLEYQRGNGSRYFDCGGALISKRYVLTAAHCMNKNLMGVRLGEHDTAVDPDCYKDRSSCAPPPMNIPIEEKTVHEGYDKDNFNQYDDIALLRLTRDVTFNDFVKPICLPAGSEEFSRSYSGDRLFVAGWGLTEKMKASTAKLKVQLPGKNNAFCEDVYRRFNFNLKLRDTQLCIGGERGKDSCRGDSGGPLMTVRRDKNKDNQWYAAGVVSFGPQPCAMPNWGGVYTRVSKYVPWIEGKLRP